MADFAQRAPGITSANETGQADITPEERARREAAFVENQKDRSEARRRVMERHGDSLKALASQQARDVAMGNLLDVELKAITKERASAVVKPAPAPVREAPATTTEKPLDILDSAQWLKWKEPDTDGKLPTYSGKYLQFIGEFGMALRGAQDQISTDMQKRTQQMETIRRLYRDIVYGLLANEKHSYLNNKTRREVDAGLDVQFDEVYVKVSKLPAIR